MRTPELPENMQAEVQPLIEEVGLLQERLDKDLSYFATVPDVLERSNFKIQIPSEGLITKIIEYKLRQVPVQGRAQELQRLMKTFGLSQVMVGLSETQ